MEMSVRGPSPADAARAAGGASDHVPAEGLMFTLTFGLDWWSGCEHAAGR